MNTGQVVELFEGGWLELGEGLPRVRVIVVRHPAPPPGKDIAVGKRVGEWVYELFLTTLPTDGFLVEEVLDLYHGRGAEDRSAGFRRCRRRSRSLVFLHRVRTRTVANRLSMGVEPATDSWKDDAGS